MNDILEEFGVEPQGFVADSAEGVLTIFEEGDDSEMNGETEELAAA